MTDHASHAADPPPAAGSTVVIAPAGSAGDDADLLEYARVLWRHWKLLAVLVLGTMGVTAVANLLLAPVYRASAVVLPASGGSGPAIPSALLQAVGGGGLLGSLKGSDPTDRFVAVLGSRTLAEGVIEDCALLPHFYPDEWDAAAQAWRGDAPDLREVLSVDTTATGAIEVSAEWTDPEVAARIANAAVARLEEFLRDKDLTLAARHRQFLDQRRLETQVALAIAEEKMKAFSEKHGQAEIKTSEAQLDVLKEFRGDNDPEVQQRQLEVRALKRRLVELEHGAPDDPTMKVQANGLVPLYQLPEVGLQYARLLREVTVQNEVFTLLSAELERAKIEEKREEIAVQLLDRAQAPDRKARPRRLQNTLLAGVVAAFLGVLIAFGIEGVHKLRQRAAVEDALSSGALRIDPSVLAGTPLTAAPMPPPALPNPPPAG
ncbi:MAG: Wzz/FepE/Etk N-terminal domain-containing protein [Planctomycetota bacterium]|jgi:uncharacterized protein involved in exopolysaccharide biosynthesis